MQEGPPLFMGTPRPHPLEWVHGVSHPDIIQYSADLEAQDSTLRRAFYAAAESMTSTTHTRNAQRLTPLRQTPRGQTLVRSIALHQHP